MFKLPNEEPNISATPSRDNSNLATMPTSVKDPTFVTPSSPPRIESGSLVNPLSKVNISIVGLETKTYMRYHEHNMKNGEYDTRFFDHNRNIVTSMDVKDIVRLYCLNNQSHIETKIRLMTLK